MPDNKRVIKIESILGGQSALTHFATPGQYRSSLNINPALPIDDTISSTAYSVYGSGLLRPSPNKLISGTTITSAPQWIISSPKDGYVYVYDLSGSAYTISTSDAVSALSDGGTLALSSGNGCEYYDNYIYFAKNTDIARYGPLNGSPAFTGTYWTGTLSKTALVNTTYPETVDVNTLPNHVLHRHSDGRLYIADVVGNQGTIHYIQTTKTTVEGDTDNGSTYNKLQVGYGLWPTAMESYGSDLVIAFYEGSNAGSREQRAKLAFWDTTSANVNKITWVEFPDPVIGALKNVNGVLYVSSGVNKQRGFRVSRFVGGYTIEEIFYIEDASMPLAGAVDGTAQRLLFGSFTNVPFSSSAVYSYGLQKSALGKGIFNLMSPVIADANSVVTALSLSRGGNGLGNDLPYVGVASAGGLGQIWAPTSGTYQVNSLFWSQMYRIGQPFKITKIRIPLVQAVAANMTITPKIITDDAVGTAYTLTAINNTNYSGASNIVYRLEGVTGKHNFFLELRWTGSVLLTVNLPITIEYELIDD